MQAKTGRLLLIAAFVMALLTLMSLPAMAAPVTVNYELNQTNLSGKAAPYANVALTLSTDKKSIDVSVSTSGSYVLWGKGDVFAFNYAGGGNLLSISSIDNSSDATFKADFAGRQGLPMGGGFGKFQYAIDVLKASSGPGQIVGNNLTFVVARKDNSTFNSASDIANGTYPFAIELATCGACSPGTRRLTGWAGGGTQTSPVPEPGSLALLGAGLVSFGGLMRRYRR